MNEVGNPEALQSVLGFAIDSQNQMWILDMGYTASDEASLQGGQKLIVWDLTTNQEVRRIPITDDLASPTTSFLNDMALDEQNQMLYISDSGNRAGSSVASGIIVMDLVTGSARRVLDRHPTTANNPATPLTIEGVQVFPDNPLQVGINGIALSPDGAELYWSVTTGDALYSIPTSVLRKRDNSEAEIEAAVKTLAEGIGGTDGLAVDAAGNVYITALSQNALLRYSPALGEVETFARSPEFI
ncbi:MAG: L-dopachrome tautomerase-related protein [Trueperaceae bacterium]